MKNLLLLLLVVVSLVHGLSRQRRMCGSRLSQKVIEICSSVSSLEDGKPFSGAFSTLVAACCRNPCSEEDILDYCLSRQEKVPEPDFQLIYD